MKVVVLLSAAANFGAICIWLRADDKPFDNIGALAPDPQNDPVNPAAAANPAEDKRAQYEDKSPETDGKAENPPAESKGTDEAPTAEEKKEGEAGGEGEGEKPHHLGHHHHRGTQALINLENMNPDTGRDKANEMMLTPAEQKHPPKPCVTSEPAADPMQKKSSKACAII